ncbi:hypothetical protein CDAR_265701 [Caerostris darwini]|uniref:Integrase zinc-binding domain-containing protein n=1 Tax=Caerostris darwini TaxID=1538125 RepID=A0AAV4T3Z2_9ARAC|nr:hypothetical protein CDAR_265701 [Caerostris darwini]
MNEEELRQESLEEKRKQGALEEKRRVEEKYHSGEGGTCQVIIQRYYWSCMKSYIKSCGKRCPVCCRFKAINQKPVGLTRTLVYAQLFETSSIDLFGSVSKSKEGHKWNLIAEDWATIWVELFPLVSATAYVKTTANATLRKREMPMLKSDDVSNTSCNLETEGRTSRII